MTAITDFLLTGLLNYGALVLEHLDADGIAGAQWVFRLGDGGGGLGQGGGADACHGQKEGHEEGVWAE